MLRAEYTYAKGDFLDLFRARRKYSGWDGIEGFTKRLVILLAFVAAGALIGVVLAGGGRNLLSRQTLLIEWGPLLLGWAPLVVLALLYAVLIHFFAPTLAGYMYYPRLAIAGRSVRYDLTDEGLAWSAPTGTGQMPWSAITKVIVLPAAIVLFISKIEGVVLPRRAFAGGQFDAAVAFVAAKTGGLPAFPAVAA